MKCGGRLTWIGGEPQHQKSASVLSHGTRMGIEGALPYTHTHARASAPFPPPLGFSSTLAVVTAQD